MFRFSYFLVYLHVHWTFAWQVQGLITSQWQLWYFPRCSFFSILNFGRAGGDLRCTCTCCTCTCTSTCIASFFVSKQAGSVLDVSSYLFVYLFFCSPTVDSTMRLELFFLWPRSVQTTCKSLSRLGRCSGSWHRATVVSHVAMFARSLQSSSHVEYDTVVL
jgi:hypothetical protein